MTVSLASALSDPDVAGRIDTIARLVQDPEASRPALVAIINDSTNLVARLWGMIGICQIGDDEQGLATQALIECLSASEAVVRRTATIGTPAALEALRRRFPILDEGRPTNRR
jgi:HEAT repeat protein